MIYYFFLQHPKTAFSDLLLESVSRANLSGFTTPQ